MNVGVLIIITVAVALVAIVVLPRFRGFASKEPTTVERRAGRDRRQRHVRVPVERRKRARRAEDAAKSFVENLTTN